MTALWSAIVNGTILSALLTLAVWLALRVTPRRVLNAATRYAIWWIVLLATLALPLSFAHWRQDVATPVYSQDIPMARTAPAIPAVPVATPRVTLPLEIPAAPWLRILLFAWIAAASLLLLRLALSYATLYRRTVRAVPPPGTRIAVSDEINIPLAVGPFRRAILIPAKLFATITESDLDQIVLHEAAHLARRDDYTLFLQRIIEALFPLHPVVRWITRQLDLEREIACDDAVARSTATARSYADCLTRMVQACGGVRPSVAAAAFADSRSHFSRRVELLVQKGRAAQVTLLKGRCALIAVALIGAASLLAKTPLLLTFSTPHTTSPMAAPVQVIKPTFTQPAPQPRVLAQNLPPSFIEQRKLFMQQLKDRQFDQAIATLNRLIAEAPDNRTRLDLYSAQSEAYRQKGDFNGAINAAEQAAALAPDNAAVFANLGLLYDAQGNFVQARRNYERSIAIDPNNPLALNNLAYMLAETGGDLDQALAYARTAQQKLPSFKEVEDTIGWIYLKKGMISDAVGQFKILVDAMPDNPEYHYHYALALFQQDNRQEAFIQAKTAESKNPRPELERQIRDLIDNLAPIMDTPLGSAPIK